MGTQYVNDEYNTHGTFLIYFIPHVVCSVLTYRHDKCFLPDTFQLIIHHCHHI